MPPGGGDIHITILNGGGSKGITITPTGKVGIGNATAPIVDLEIEGTSAAIMQATRYTASAEGSPFFNFRKSRGTAASPLVVNQNDNLGLFYFYGWKDEKTSAPTRIAEWVPAAGFGGGVENDSATEHLVKGFIFFKTNTVGDFTVDGTEKMRLSNAGKLGIGITDPTAYLHLKAGTATAGTAPIKLTSGTLLATPESGTIEFDGTKWYMTV